LHQFTHPAHTKEIFLLVNTSILLHLILGINEMWILKELNVLLNRFICGESDEDTKSHAKVSLIQFFLAAILVILPMVFFDVQMYTATATEQ
jgi:hypothetical protein